MTEHRFIRGRPEKSMAPTRFVPAGSPVDGKARSFEYASEPNGSAGQKHVDIVPRRRVAIGRIAAMMLAAVTLGACGLADAEPAKAEEKAAAEVPASPSATPAMGVEVAVARSESIASEVSVTGRVEAVQAIDVRPELDGRIVAIVAREGQAVAAGTPLFRLDDAELEAQVARATAERDLAHQTLERTRGLIAQNASARADLERAEALERGAQAQLDLLSVRLARTTVRAPFAGVIGRRFVSLGDYVSPQVRLTSLQTTNPQRVTLDVPERFAAELRRGQRVEFGVAAYPGQRFTATVDFVDPVVALPARTILVKALAANPDGRLQTGMFVEARLATAVRGAAIVIPEQALMPAPGGRNAVWAVVDGKAQRREVTIGVRRAGQVEITSGIAAGEQVVVGGVLQLAEGAPVRATFGDQPKAEPVAAVPGRK